MSVEVVVKIGGGLLAETDRLDLVLAELRAHGVAPFVIVPGGGPFADVVRDIDRRLSLTDSAGHWMAVLAMNQYAELIVARLEGSTLVSTAADIGEAIREGRVPVLAPYQWLRQADPLPHSWDVTSDSIAAWLARALGARRLVLVKPSNATGLLVDPRFASIVPPGVAVSIVPANEVATLRAAVGLERDSASVVP